MVSLARCLQAGIFRRLFYFMNILKGIGAGFTRFWRWIKETAWVQPLLIVGAIFAVIFSIPKMTSWVQALGVGDTSNAYYMAKRESLEGENKGYEMDSKADQLTYSLLEWSNFDDRQNSFEDYQAYRAAMAASEENPVEKYGEKFFLVYVDTNDSSNSAQGGFQNLEDNWGTRYKADDGRDYSFRTIYTDEDSSNDDDFDLDTEKVAFNRYLLKFDDLGFFSDAGARFDECPYKINASLTSSSNYDNFIDAGTKLTSESFIKTTIILVDFSEEAFNVGRVGVSEVLFNLSGNTDYDKATLLMNMWNHTSTTDKANPFTSVYVKA